MGICRWLEAVIFMAFFAEDSLYSSREGFVDSGGDSGDRVLEGIGMRQ